MTEYAIILAASFVIPFAFSFEKKIKFIKRIKIVSKTIIAVGVPYLVWDALFAKSGVWGFSKERVSEIKIFSLPLEEILFFVVVPYALIFVYEVVNFYIKDSKIRLDTKLLIFPCLAFLTAAIIFFPKVYTTVQSLVTSFFFFLMFILKHELMQSRNFWIFIFISYLPFLIVNYLLTSIPIVWYDNSQNLGVRIITIPFEDFFYHFTYTAFIILIYTYFSAKE